MRDNRLKYLYNDINFVIHIYGATRKLLHEHTAYLKELLKEHNMDVYITDVIYNENIKYSPEYNDYNYWTSRLIFSNKQSFIAFKLLVA